MQPQTFLETVYRVYVTDHYGESYRIGVYDSLAEAVTAAEDSIDCVYDRDTGYWSPKDRAEDRISIEQSIYLDDDSAPITREKSLRRWYSELA